MDVNLAIISAFVLIYSMVCGGLERTPFNGALVYTAFGLGLGPLGLGFLSLDVDAEDLRTLAELSLALVLFTDASNADLAVLKKSMVLPKRLLLVGLPFTILLGFGTGVLVFGDLTFLEVAILATLLAPTDAALGKAVVTNEAVPLRIRESLNVESGLNDGICVPILFMFLTLAVGAAENGGYATLALKLVAEEIGIGVVVGIGLTLLGSLLFKEADKRGWVAETWLQLPVVSLAVACFAMAQALGGSGFIAAFSGGLLFSAMVKKHKHALLLAAEGTGDTLALFTWIVFGSAVVGQTVGFLSWSVIIYSLLSLTLIRMLPVFLVLTGTGLCTDEKLFVGWFGPRGLASIVFGVIVLKEHLPGGGTIVITTVCTIMLSVLAHGVSANPLVAVLAARVRERRGSME